MPDDNLPSLANSDATRPLSDAERKLLANLEPHPAKVVVRKGKRKLLIRYITPDSSDTEMAKPDDGQDLEDALERQLNQELEELDEGEGEVNTDAEDGHSAQDPLNDSDDELFGDEDNVDDGEVEDDLGMDDPDDELTDLVKAAMEKHKFPNPPVMPTSKKVAYCGQVQAVRRAHVLLGEDNPILPNVMVHIAKVYRDLSTGKGKTALSQTKTVRNARMQVNRAFKAFKTGKD